MADNTEEVQYGHKPNTNYGFLTNLRQRPTDNVFRIRFLDDLVTDSNYNIRAGRLIYVMLGFVFLALPIIFYTFSNLVRMKYIILPVGVILLAITIFVVQYLFTEPATGSMLSKALRFSKFLLYKYRIKSGRGTAPRRTHLSNVDEEGYIEFSNGDVGKALLVDGSTSITAYPEEVRELENLNQSFQQSRDRDVTEIKITSSQRQTTVEQQREMDELISRSNETAIDELVNQQKNFLKNYVDGQRSTIVQHIIVRAPDRDTLDNYIDKMYAFQRRGLYYRLDELSVEDTDEVLNIFRFE